MKTAIGTLVAMALAACGTDERSETPGAEPVAPATTVYDCEGSDGAVSFTTRTRARGLALWLPPQFELPYIVLELVPAASGAKYVNGKTTVWTHGDDAILEVDGKRIAECRRNVHASIWEHAKLGGVDFRAVGNEPGWVLEIRERTRVEFTYDYGASTLSANTSEPVNDTEGTRTVWKTQVNGQPLTIGISARACSDSMSGEQFESTVVIDIGGRTFSGCGRALH